MCMTFSGAYAITPENEFAVYVVPKTSDVSVGDGTLENPFQGVEAARDYIRELRRDGKLAERSVNVYLRGGVYQQNETFKLEKEDSGTEKYPVTYKAYKDEKVEFFGSKVLNKNTVKKLTDKSILKRIPEEAHGHVYQIDLAANGVTDFGTFPRRNYNNSWGSDDFSPGELFIDGTAQTIARYPNGSDQYMKTGDIVKKGGTYGNSISRTSTGWIFKYTDDRAERWITADNAWIWGFLMYDYGYCNAQIKDIDIINKTIETTCGIVYGVAKGKDFFISNLLEEIDVPGEYYVDTKTGMLYFYPPYDISDSQLVFSDCYGAMVSFEDTSYINFENMKIGYNKETGIYMKNTDHCVVRDCEITNTGFYGVLIEGGNDSGVSGGSLHDVGARAVQINDGGDKETLTPCNNFVENCDIYRWSRIAFIINAVQALRSVGVRFSNNCMHDAPMAAIHIQESNNCIIEKNEIYNVLQQTNDNGSSYAGQRWDNYGNVWRNNFFHDIYVNRGNNTTHAFGVYFDDTYSGGSILNNVFYKVATAFLIGGGNDNTVVGNLSVDCPHSFILDSRGYNGFAKKHVSYPNGAAYQSLINSPWESEAWKKAYPTLELYFTDEFRGKGIPARNKVKSNWFVGTGGPTTLVDIAVQYGDFGDNYYDDYELEFKDKENLDFSLTEDSEFYKRCPEAEWWDFSTVGISEREIPKSNIELIYPRNNQKNVYYDDVLFQWNDTGYCGPYIITVALDKEMNNIVHQEQTYIQNVTLDKLKGKERTYYWTVEPVYQGKNQQQNKGQHKTQVYSFTMCKESYIPEESELKKYVDNIVEKSANIKIGDGLGEYPKEAYDEFMAALEKAKKYAEDKFMTDVKKNEALGEFTQAVEKFNKQVHYEVVTEKGMLNPNNWNYPQGIKKVDENSVNISQYGSGSDLSTYLGREFGKYEALKFKIKVLNPPSWWTLTLRGDNPDTNAFYNNNKNISVLFKTTSIEVQRYPGPNGGIIKTIQWNDEVVANVWLDIEVGAIDVFNGVMIFVKVNGKDYVSHTDSKLEGVDYSKGGYFMMNGSSVADLPLLTLKIE